MKKAFALTILAMLLMVTWWGCSTAEEKQKECQSGDFSYVLLEEGTANIADYSGGESSLSIPDKLDGYTVTTIGAWAFDDCENLTSVTIPDSVISIGERAFLWCSRQTSFS